MGLRTFLGIKKRKVRPPPPAWAADLNITADWATPNFENWRRCLRGRDIGSVLEIGSYEGLSANFFLREFPTAQLVCIDTFAGTPDHDPEIVAGIEGRFDENTRQFGDRVVKIKSRSVPALDLLAVQQRSFDTIYIDGSHRRDDVIADTILSWRLLRCGGVLIWDDYAWFVKKRPGSERPKDAVDLFLRAFRNSLTVLHKDFQVIVLKRADWPA